MGIACTTRCVVQMLPLQLANLIFLLAYLWFTDHESNKNNLLAKKKKMIWHKKTRDRREEEEKKKNKTLEIYQSSNDDTHNIIKKISTRRIHRHHQKLTLELLVSHMYRLKMVVYSLVDISSPTLKFAFHGVYKFVLSRSFNGIKNIIIRVVMSLTFLSLFVSFSFLFSLSSLVFLCHVFSFFIH